MIPAVAATWLAATLAGAAPLPAGVELHNPDTGHAGHGFFTTALPGYINDANRVTTFVSNMTLDFTGTVTTGVYNNPLGGYTFTYILRNTGTTAEPYLVRATFRPEDWAGVTITDAGADGSGSSGNGDPTAEWTDGDPRHIGRASSGYPQFQWREANEGTVIGGGDVSAVLFLETTTKAFTISQVGLLDGAAVGKAEVLVVPAPAAALLGVLGLGMIGHVKRRFG